MIPDGRLEPGDAVGVLGSGQLARMMALAAAPLGLRLAVYAPETGPAFDVATSRHLGAYDDAVALGRFAAEVGVVTFEFENVPAAALEVLGRLRPVRPGPGALASTQDRLAEKTFLNRLGIATVPFRVVDDLGSLGEALAAFGGAGILKTRRFGYDGKGQVRIAPVDDPAAALVAIGHAPAILEGIAPFAREVSVVAARALDGAFAAYDPPENRHAEGILRVSRVPADLAPTLAAEAVAATRRVMEALDYVGVLAVEFFVLGEGGAARLLANEIAPRVHNSGHWTIEGAETSQFAQHLRAVAGWPLGSTRLRGKGATMTNLIGPEVASWAAHLAEPGAALHLYGKHRPAPGRKMGHVTRVEG